MVTARTPGTDSSNFKRYYDEMIERFGSTFTSTRSAITRDSLGNVTAVAETTSTIEGDFQRIVDEKELARLGVVGIGSAKFYCKSSSNLVERDVLSVNSENWLVKRRTEDDSFGDIEVGETWLLVRLDGCSLWLIFMVLEKI